MVDFPNLLFLHLPPKLGEHHVWGFVRSRLSFCMAFYVAEHRFSSLHDYRHHVGSLLPIVVAEGASVLIMYGLISDHSYPKKTAATAMAAMTPQRSVSRPAITAWRVLRTPTEPK